MSRETGIDFKSFFKPELYKINGDKRFSDSEIAFYYKQVQSLSIKAGIRFNTCYIGNGTKDYYQYQNLWDNKKDCCDAIGNVSGFKTTSQEVPWSFREKQAPCKETAQESKQTEEQFEREWFPAAKLPESRPEL
jgi:uncharacterized protein (DUF2461 family)